MKKVVLFVLATCMAMGMAAQLPQFSSKNFEGWIYPEQGYPLTQSNILKNKIVLYTTTTGLQLTLTSPQFNCSPGQKIDMKVTYALDQWQNSNFVARKVALTATLLDDEGVPVDSVTYTPTSVNRTINMIYLSIIVPEGLTVAQMRFAAWKADVNSCGAVRQIEMFSTLKGDVNGDGEVSIADVNAIIGLILGDAVEDMVRERADVNCDGEVSVGDINTVIDIIQD